jgi:hypothetical protein
MATLNVSVTQSNVLLTSAVSSGSTLDFVIDNPISYTSYFTLETVADNNGFYTNLTSKNTSGSFTLGAGQFGLVQSNYMASVVVSSGVTTLSFIPAVDIPANTLYLRGVGAGPYTTTSTVDADAQAFFDRVTAAGGTLSTTEQTATNQLVLDLKANSLWTPMKAIYPMVGASAAACAQNLKSSSFTGTFTSGWTFASTGVTPNGTSAYMNTNYLMSSSNGFSNNNYHLSYYSRTNNSSTVEMGVGITSPSNFINLFLRLSGNIGGSQGIRPSFSIATANSLGLGLITGLSSTLGKLFKNGSLLQTQTQTQTATSEFGVNMILGGQFYSGIANDFTNRQCAFSSIGDGLTDTQASDFYTAVQAFQTTLSRQV